MHCIAMHCNVRLLCIQYAALLKNAISMIKFYYYSVFWSFDVKCSKMHLHKNNVLLLCTNVTHCSKNALSIIRFHYYYSVLKKFNRRKWLQEEGVKWSENKKEINWIQVTNRPILVNRTGAVGCSPSVPYVPSVPSVAICAGDEAPIELPPPPPPPSPPSLQQIPHPYHLSQSSKKRWKTNAFH